MNQAIECRRTLCGKLIAHARGESHQECCGILAGQKGVITAAFPARNVAADPVENYRIAPQQILGLLGCLRQRRLDVLGIYHSHPHWMHSNEPSAKDIALACYRDVVYFIVTPRPYATAPIRAFSIRNGRATELEIQFLR